MNENNLMNERFILQNQVNAGASWFYWVAALSIINSLIIMFSGNLSFIVGLGITQIFDYIGKEFGTIGNILAFGIDLIIAGIFVFFGVFANKGHNWSFIIGMVLYSLDGLLYLIPGDFLAFGFHIFVLYCLFSGLKANSKLKQIASS